MCKSGRGCDFTESGKSEQGNQLLEVNPGGAPCNVLVMLTKLGKKTAFIGKVGNDIFGNLLRKTLEEVGIASGELHVDDNFGTLSMTHEGVRNATKKAVKAAKEKGCLISFDPNLRPPLWETLELAREQMEYGFGQCDILRISDNEIQFVTGKEDYDE